MPHRHWQKAPLGSTTQAHARTACAWGPRFGITTSDVTSCRAERRPIMLDKGGDEDYRRKKKPGCSKGFANKKVSAKRMLVRSRGRHRCEREPEGQFA